jgi:hypothetical protein
MSTLKADTIQNTSGGAVTLTNQSAAKAWSYFDGRTTNSILDSLNYSSLTDHGIGAYTMTVINAMNNATYSHSTTAGWTTTSLINISTANETTAITTTATRYSVTYVNAANFDSDQISVTLHGDLA